MRMRSGRVKLFFIPVPSNKYYTNMREQNFPLFSAPASELGDRGDSAAPGRVPPVRFLSGTDQGSGLIDRTRRHRDGNRLHL